MANVIKPSNSAFFYTVTKDDVSPVVVQSIQELNPPATLVDNSDELWYMTGLIRPTVDLTEEYWIDTSVDTNGFAIPGWLPTTVGS